MNSFDISSKLTNELTETETESDFDSDEFSDSNKISNSDNEKSQETYSSSDTYTDTSIASDCSEDEKHEVLNEFDFFNILYGEAYSLENDLKAFEAAGKGKVGRPKKPEEAPRFFFKLNRINVPKLFEFKEKAGPNIDLKKPIDIFLSFFDDSLINSIVKETNRYSLIPKKYVVRKKRKVTNKKKIKLRKRPYKPRKKKKPQINSNQAELLSTEAKIKLKEIIAEKKKIFEPLTDTEFISYIGVKILMGLIRKPQVAYYWSRNNFIETPIFGKYFTKKRFNDITTNLHFEHNAQNALEKDKKLRNNDYEKDCLYKLRGVINHLKLKFKQNYTPHQKISIDESVLRYRGRLPKSLKVKMPSKRAREGIKLFKLCDSRSSYCYNFRINFATKENKECKNNKVKNLVKELLSSEEICFHSFPKNITNKKYSLLGKGYIIFTDKYFSSIELALQLQELNTYLVGTTINDSRFDEKLAKYVDFVKKNTEVENKRLANMKLFPIEDEILTEDQKIETLNNEEKNPKLKETVKKNPTQVVDNKNQTQIVNNNSTNVFVNTATSNQVVANVQLTKEEKIKKLNEENNKPYGKEKIILPRYATIFSSCSINNILALKFNDNDCVNLISTYHVDDDSVIVLKKRKDFKTQKMYHVKQKLPKCILDFRLHMKGVDVNDQYLAYSTVVRRYKKYYLKIFFYLLDITIFNSFVIYKENNNTKSTFYNFKFSLAQQLLESNKEKNFNNKKHFLRENMSAGNKSKYLRCVVCNLTGRTDTKYICNKCEKPLCVACFPKFHNLK